MSAQAPEGCDRLFGDWRMTATDSDGERVESSGRAIEVVRRQADGT